MTWLRDEDDMLDHEKWRRALRDGGDGALLVWARLRAWCSRRLTDGFVPADMVDGVAEIGRSKSRARALRALVEHGLCAYRERGALEVVGYLERNPSAASVRSERARRAEAQKNRRILPSVTGLHGGTEPEVKPPRDEVPSQSRPNPVPIPEGEDPPTPEDVISVNPRKGRFAPEDLEPTAAQRVRCQELRFDPNDLLARFKLQEFNRDYTDWPRRFSIWIEDQKLKRETEQARPGPRAFPGSDLDTTGAATAFNPNSDARDFARDHLPGKDPEFFARQMRGIARFASLSTPEQDREFLARLRCFKATGIFHPDGPLPKGPRKAGAKEMRP